MKNERHTRIVAAYDSETSTVQNGLVSKSFPIIHQIGILNGRIEDVNAENVTDKVEIKTFRHTSDVVLELKRIMDINLVFIPVVMVHNLSFDFYALYEFLDCYNVDVVAKSTTKPVTFKILDSNGDIRMIIWDTLAFTGMSLERMGDICGYSKSVGCWDYDLVRTPETVLTRNEMRYAYDDIYALFAYMGYFTRLNRELENEYGLDLLTKTGLVRSKRKAFIYELKPEKRYAIPCGKSWEYRNRNQKPDDDDQLYTMQACNRGGFTFVSTRNVAKCFHSNERESIYAYDANSQHPAQMLSHRVPVRWRKATSKALEHCINTVFVKTWHDLLLHADKPFPIACEACFRVRNIRLKGCYETHGIGSFAESRFRIPKLTNVNSNLIAEIIMMNRYHDSAVNPVFEFGKLVKADECILFLSELGLFELNTVYDFDSIEPVAGYVSTNWAFPTDYSMLSVVEFYDRKQVFKRLKPDDSKPQWIPDFIWRNMFDDEKIRREYYQILKSDLNSLYGIEVTNEYKQDYEMSGIGIIPTIESGIECGNRLPKTDYHYGERIVGWSRIAQLYVIDCVARYGEIINGDTDSIKFFVARSDRTAIEKEMAKWGDALRKSRESIMIRIGNYKGYEGSTDLVKEAGYYELEGEFSAMCAAWNKCYMVDDNGDFKLTIAGINCENPRSAKCIADIANDLASDIGFDDVAAKLLSYNLNIHESVTGELQKKTPEWRERYEGFITDYLGNRTYVNEPCSMTLIPMGKILGGFSVKSNIDNFKIASNNNPDVLSVPRTLRVYENGDFGFEVFE